MTIKQNCADGQVPEWDYYGIHYRSATDAEFKDEMVRRGYEVVGDVRRIVDGVGCNEARRAVFAAWKDCKCAHVEYAGNYDATLGRNCAVWGFNGSYGGTPQRLAAEGEPIPGFYGRDV